jgi:LPXTG-site transpeptidase (sortase) family protein
MIEYWKRKKLALGLMTFIALGVMVANWSFIKNWSAFQLFSGRKDIYRDSLPHLSPEEKTEPNTLQIQALGVKAPLVYVNQVSEEIFQKALETGVVHYPGTALPGQIGNCYIFGHSSDYLWSQGKYKSIFVNLPQIKQGDWIEVTDSEGSRFTYEVYEVLVVKPTDLGQLSQETGEKKILTLQTSYPIGTALKRFLVKAELKK